MNDIDTFVKKFTDEKIKYVKKGKKYFLMNEEVSAVDKMLPDAISSGIILGESKDNFKPSLYLLEVLSAHSKNKLYVNEKAEWLFLCGRDVLPESVIGDHSAGIIFLVQNEKDENLGFGKKIHQGKKYFIKNITDRGNFLRRERG